MKKGERQPPAELHRVPLRVGDVLVLHCPDYLSPAAQHWLNDEFAKLFPGTKLLILDGGKRLGILGDV